jgi:hypothetical protein
MNPTLTQQLAAERARDLRDAADRHRRATVPTSKPRLRVLTLRPLTRRRLVPARGSAGA